MIPRSRRSGSSLFSWTALTVVVGLGGGCRTGQSDPGATANSPTATSTGAAVTAAADPHWPQVCWDRLARLRDDLGREDRWFLRAKVVWRKGEGGKAHSDPPGEGQSGPLTVELKAADDWLSYVASAEWHGRTEPAPDASGQYGRWDPNGAPDVKEQELSRRDARRRGKVASVDNPDSERRRRFSQAAQHAIDDCLAAMKADPASP